MPDFRLKDYQEQAISTLRSYFEACQRIGNADSAFYEITRGMRGIGVPYQPVRELPGLPYVCIRIPTGGGKTVVAAHAVGVAADALLRRKQPVVVWLTPSNIIRAQTLRALRDRAHPYHDALTRACGAVAVLDIEEALYVQPATLNATATVIVATMQAFRVDDTDGRRVYESSGALMSHFDRLPDDLRPRLANDAGALPYSLANVLRIHRPIVIVDEAHNARTPLSFETLARFDPCCILEITATPDPASNVLYSASAGELKAADMIKMPVKLQTRAAWRDVMADAVGQLRRLEEIARDEQRATGEYIRPIMLLQAQPRYQHRDSLTVDVVEQTLKSDFGVPAEHIARATGGDHDLDDVDLLAPACPIRYIITVQQLREGWDCPFAYVLCSVAEMRSGTAVEQILGRLMRLPCARRKQRPELNVAYAFAATDHFSVAADALVEGLVENGFEEQTAQAFVQRLEQPSLGPLFAQPGQVAEPVTIPSVSPVQASTLPLDIAQYVIYDGARLELTFSAELSDRDWQTVSGCLSAPESRRAIEYARQKARQTPRRSSSPAERGEPFAVPVLTIRQGVLIEPFEATHFRETPWNLAGCDAALSEQEYPSQRPSGQQYEIDVSKQGHLQVRFLADLNQQMALLVNDQGWTAADLTLWLDSAISHPDIPADQARAFLARITQQLMDGRGLSLEHLVQDKYQLRNAAEARIDRHRQAVYNAAYQSLLLPDSATPLTVTPDVCFSFAPDDSSYPYNTLYQGAYQFRKHYYTRVGNLAAEGEEFECARFVDQMPMVKYWVRNPERKPARAFWLQTSTDKFYPDFVCLLRDDRILVVEYKGLDHWSNDDSKEKRLIGEIWEKHSIGRCLFVMPCGADLEAIRSKPNQARK